MNCKILTKNNEVLLVSVDYRPIDFLVVNKALKLLAENEEVHLNDRTTAELMIKEFDKALKKKR